MTVSRKFLLDTHIFLWWLAADRRLSSIVKEKIALSQNTIYVSVASIWEMYIKREKGKLKFPRQIEEAIEKTGFYVLPISLNHVLHLPPLKRSHKDPFDRMLVAQARMEKLTLITKDEKFKQYQVSLLI